MAAPECINHKFMDSYDDDDDDDHMPLSFKRSSTTSKQKELNSDIKHKLGLTSKVNKEQVSSSRKSVGSVSTSGKVKVTPDARRNCVADSDDSDDDKPLNMRRAVASATVQTNNPTDLSGKINASSQSNAPTISQKRSSSKSSSSTIPSTSVKRSYDSDDEKPLSSKFQQNGFSKSCSRSAGVSDNGFKKRPPSSMDNSGSTHKKIKISSPPGHVKVKQESVVKVPGIMDNSDSSHKKMKISSPANMKVKQEPVIKVPGSMDDSDASHKKMKISSPPGGPGHMKVKQEPVIKEETRVQRDEDNEDDEDDEYVPICQTINKPISHKNPLSTVKTVDNSDASHKKMKISSPPGHMKVKQEPAMKEETRLQRDEDDEDDEDHVPIGQKINKPVSHKNPLSTVKTVKKVSTSSKKEPKKPFKEIKKSKFSKSPKMQPGSGDGQKKWTSLTHSGVIFPPPYKPHGIKMLYNGQPVDLTPEQEEVATMFAVMKDTEYATKKIFLENFMADWRPILGKNHIIKKFELCDFTPIYEWHMQEKEKKKQMSTEEKKALKEEKMKNEEKYMWAIVDGVKEKVGNFRVEPPGLFRGRGEHPKMGKLKKRIQPKDITINIGKDAPIPECPIPGQRWKEVRHDNTVTWLAYWVDPINTREFKYVFLAASSSLKGQSDKEKYEKARKLKDYIHNIRSTYTRDFTSKDETKRQIAVATYLIDKLALRAGNEKDDDEADTVGCCTLKVENVTLVPPNKLQFDFLGKDSIRYFNTVEVELPVYKAIGGFRTGGKKDGDDLFDKLDTSKLNAHLKELMPGLTAKVFRTYNASITLDKMLNKDTKDGLVQEKIAVYQSANKEVAIICNHQRSVSKSHDAQMMRLDQKIADLRAEQEELKIDLNRAKKGKPPLKDAEGKTKRNLSAEALQKKLVQIDTRIEKMELDKRIKDDLKTVALGTSKINYLDPRISVAWCKRREVPIEKIFNKSLLAKFSWAMDVDPDFRF